MQENRYDLNSLARDLLNNSSDDSILQRAVSAYMRTPYNSAPQQLDQQQQQQYLEGIPDMDIDIQELSNSNVYTDNKGKWHSDNPYANALIQIESSGDAKATNSKSNAKGLYQFVGQTARNMGLDDPYDPYKAHQAFIRLVQENVRELKKYGVPANTDTLWWSHNIGAKQASEVYKYITEGKPVSDRTLKYIKLNGGFTDPKKYAEHYSERINKYLGRI